MYKKTRQDLDNILNRLTTTVTMKEEINCACEFLCSNIRASSGSVLTQGQLETYKTVLKKLIVHKFTNHWYPDKPMKGNGFRCVNIDKDTKVVDPMLVKAAEVSDISKEIFLLAFRFGLALWIDPGDVSYRTGHSSNVVSLYKTTTPTDIGCTPLPVRYQHPVSNLQLNPVHPNGAVGNTLDHQWKRQNMFSYPQLTSKQLKQILQRRNLESFHWANTNYVPIKQVTEVY